MKRDLQGSPQDLAAFSILKWGERGGRLACYHYQLHGVTPSKVLTLKQEMEKNIYIYKNT